MSLRRVDHGHVPAIDDDRPARADRRMRALLAIPTTNQMYSGIGRAIVELARRLRDRVDLTVALDDRDPHAIRRVWDVARQIGAEVRVGRHRFETDCVEPLNAELGGIIDEGGWDLIELVGFANAATGRVVLDRIDDRTALCYTPHDQPLWTVPMTPEQAGNVAEVHRRVIDRADVVLADSPAERRELQLLAPQRLNCVDVPLGCDFDAFDAGPPERPPQLLFVGDLAEIRKRFDRVVGLFERVLAGSPEYRLVVIGNRSDEAAGRIPATIRHAVDLRGYVDERALRTAYGSSRALLLLSDVEAFGLPILEALVSGTPAVLGGLETTSSLFGDCAGAHFVPLDDPGGTFAVVDRLLGRWRDAVAEATADRPRLRSAFDWDRLADRKWRALRAAWFRRNASAGPAPAGRSRRDLESTQSGARRCR